MKWDDGADGDSRRQATRPIKTGWQADDHVRLTTSNRVKSRLTTDDLDSFYREILGEHVHHGFWHSDAETAEEATHHLNR